MPFPFESAPVHAWGQTREEWRAGAPRKKLIGDISVF
jgi:hypothetical protein